MSDLTTNIYLPDAVAADAAKRVAVLVTRAPDGLLAQLTQVGATYRQTRLGDRTLLEDIRGVPRAYRLIPSDEWRVLGEAALPSSVGDGDMGTGWPPNQGRGRWPRGVKVDLGATYPVARLLWWPTTETDETLPTEVARSLDGLDWEPLGVALADRRPAYVIGERVHFRPRNGWLEFRPSARPTRYLRFRPLPPDPGSPWQVGEITVYVDVGPATGGEPETADLVRELRRRRITRLLADPATSARVAIATGGGEVSVELANGVLDSHGKAVPLATLAREIRLGAGTALLVSAEEADAVRARLQAAGVTVEDARLGDRALLHPVRVPASSLPCRRAEWRVTETEARSPDGGARYTVEARFPEERRLEAVRVRHPGVPARGVPEPVVWVSRDGQAWHEVDGARWKARWSWAGRTLFTLTGDAQEVVMPSVSARHVLVCPRCAGLRRIVGAVTEPPARRRLLAALGRATKPSPIAGGPAVVSVR